VARGQLPPPSEVAPGCPPELERICLKALAARPEDRYGAASDLRAALEEFLTARRLSTPAKRVASFMRRHFEVERERTRRRVERLIQAMPDVAAMRPAPRLRALANLRNARRRLRRRLGKVSPLMALGFGLVTAALLTFVVMSQREAALRAELEQCIRR
jgi:hypothetical protein